MRLELGFFVRE
ncbi:hypothetical protein VCHC41A1_3589, partial [Vibrio cholerae HC-41A1]